uniref:Secreted protein n=1 Tax=Rhipicephalus zambeziensis TaxID=60191 RepID=A0A224YBP2_9ACAR
MAGARFQFKMTLMLTCSVYLLSCIAPTKVFKNVVVIVQFFCVRDCREGRHFSAIPFRAFSVWPVVGVTVRPRREHNITHRCTMRFVYRADDFQRPWLEL